MTRKTEESAATERHNRWLEGKKGKSEISGLNKNIHRKENR
jgi:hypothetical protein